MKYKEVFKFFKKYFYEERTLFFKSMFFIIIGAIIGMLYGYIMGIITDLVANKVFNAAVLCLFLYMFLGLFDELIFTRLGQIFLNKIGYNMIEKIGYEVYYKVGLLPARAFEEKSSGELINRIVNDSSTITETFKEIIYIGVSLVTTVVVFIYILLNNKIVAFEIVLYLIVFAIISKKFLPEIKKKQKEIQTEKDNCVAEVNETIRGIREIRALGIRRKVNINVKNIIEIIFSKSKRQMITEKDYNAIIYSLNHILEVLVFITCIIMIYNETSSFVFFISMTYYIYKFMGIIERIMGFSTAYQKMLVSIDRINEILSNKLYEDETFGNVDKTNVDGNIEFKNVTFRYHNGETNIFNNLNFKIDSNKLVAIVGKSGQGKTSIFNLLLRYFEPNKGEILIDGINLKDFNEESLRKNIAIIRQEPFLFNKSILENFKILDEKLTLQKIRNACKLAEIDDYIMSLPKKYRTIIGEGGVNLSGGQKQRMAIARALLKQSKIILFDEATSALDNVNQEKIKNVIKSLAKDHTIVVVAHRLSTIIDADEIFVVEKGEIVDSGTHKSLMKKSNIYKDLYKNEN